MNFDLEKIKPEIEVLAKKHDLKFAVLFGTAAAGKLREGSDLDVAVLRADRKHLSGSEFNDISRDLEEAFSAGFRTVDLVDLVRPNILLRYEITANGVLLYGDEVDYESYRIFAFKDYIDSQSLRDLEATLIKKRQTLLADTTHA